MSDTDVSSGVFDITIPISFDRDRRQQNSPAPSIERQMDREVAQVFREWDENVRCRTQSSFHVRPTSSSSFSSTPVATVSDKRRRRATGSISGRSPGGTARFEFPEIDIVRREDFSATDDESRSQFYVDSPTTGRRTFRIEFDVAGYDQENISVKLSGSRLIVHAVQHESESGRKSTTEFCRKVKLPADVDAASLQCTCSDGKLVVEAPTTVRRDPPSSGYSASGFPGAPPRFEPLNKPLFRNGTLTLTVELGRLFRASDVVVKVRSQNRLVIDGERRQEESNSRMTATISREFDLDRHIIPQSLRAGLTTDGLLKITAQVAPDEPDTGQQRPLVTNGLDSDRHGHIRENGADNSDTNI